MKTKKFSKLSNNSTVIEKDYMTKIKIIHKHFLGSKFFILV